MSSASSTTAANSSGLEVFVFYRYNPSETLGIVFCVLFALTSAVHTLQLTRYKTWYFIPFVIGGLCETIGYGGRIWSSQQTPNWTMQPFIIQSLLILVAPALFAASIYMILGRIVLTQTAGHLSPIPPRFLTKIFVTCDVISFCLQGGGGAMLAVAKTSSAFERGEHVIIGGLFVQLIGFGCFCFTSAVFHLRLRRRPTAKSIRTVGEGGVPWERYLVALYVVSALIFWRSVFRVVEYLQGYTGSLQSNESWLYAMDAALMFITMVILNVLHPYKVVAGNHTGGKQADGVVRTI